MSILYINFRFVLQRVTSITNNDPYVTNYYYGSIPVINQLHLASNGSKSYLISGGDSSYSWVFTHALGLWEERSCRL